MNAERCAMPVSGPGDWARAKFHDGRCSRKGVEVVDGKSYCRQHAAILCAWIEQKQAAAES